MASLMTVTILAVTRLDIRPGPIVVVTGEIGSTNVIQYAPDLSPATPWLTLTQMVLSASPAYYTDASASSATKRFYRAVVTSGAATNGPANPDPDHLVWISPGAFTMGSPELEPERRENEGPQTRVTLTQGLWMGKYEVTQGDYESVMNHNPSWFHGPPSLPVEMVSWRDATNYCAQWTTREQAAGRLPAGYVYRLPTEAEWEYACRAGTTTPNAFGSSLSSFQANFNGGYPYQGGA